VFQGALASGDITFEDGSFYDRYDLDFQAGQTFTVTFESQDFDTWVGLKWDLDRGWVPFNDDAGGSKRKL